MAKITAVSVQEKNKKRCNLFIDGEFFVGLSLETAIKFRLKPNMEVDQKDLAEIIFEDEKLQALEKAIAYTSNSLKTLKQVKTYLYSKGYHKDIVEHCVEKLIDYKLVDDKTFALRYIESTSKTQGKHLTEFKLMQKGLRKEDIEGVFDAVEIPSKENARNLAIKHFKNKEKTRENVVKTYRYLISKGFSYEEANYAVEIFKSGEED